MIPISTDKKQDWQTPQWFFDLLNHHSKFTLDAAAEAHNAKCKRFLSPKEDALADRTKWRGKVFCNPPYAKIEPWIEKATEEVVKGNAKLVVMLLPANTGTQWFAKYAPLACVEFITPRLAFEDPTRPTKSSPAHASMLLFFNLSSIRRGLELAKGNEPDCREISIVSVSTFRKPAGYKAPTTKRGKIIRLGDRKATR